MVLVTIRADRPGLPGGPTCSTHLAYLSEYVARNAATLHAWTNPACPGVNVWPCGDHWHYGHPPGVGLLCRARHVGAKRRRRRAGPPT